MRATLAAVEVELERFGFVRAHRSWLVNAGRVTGLRPEGSGDWTVELTGWSPGVSVLLPAGLILAVLVAWRLGAGPVLCFWLAYILTRPLGASLGDLLTQSREYGGLGMGATWTSAMFLCVIFILVGVAQLGAIQSKRLAP